MNILIYLAVVGVVITSLALLLLDNYRYSIGALVVQYLFIFFLVGSMWPIGLAVVKLIVGWIVCSLIGSAYFQHLDFQRESTSNAKTIFSALSAVVIWLLVFTVSSAGTSFLPVSRPILIAAGILIGMGLLQLGSTTNLLRILFGLLTVTGGFEVLYAGLEQSVLVTGLLAVINILFGFMGWYMVNHDTYLEGG
jgi:hypothetical protein